MTASSGHGNVEVIKLVTAKQLQLESAETECAPTLLWKTLLRTEDGAQFVL